MLLDYANKLTRALRIWRCLFSPALCTVSQLCFIIRTNSENISNNSCHTTIKINSITGVLGTQYRGFSVIYLDLNMYLEVDPIVSRRYYTHTRMRFFVLLNLSNLPFDLVYYELVYSRVFQVC